MKAFDYLPLIISTCIQFLKEIDTWWNMLYRPWLTIDSQGSRNTRRRWRMVVTSWEAMETELGIDPHWLYGSLGPLDRSKVTLTTNLTTRGEKLLIIDNKCSVSIELIWELIITYQLNNYEIYCENYCAYSIILRASSFVFSSKFIYIIRDLLTCALTYISKSF